MRVRRWLAGLVAALWLAGCAAGKAYRDGVDLEAAGRLPAAASRYLDALDRNPSHSKALEALGGVAEDAWKAKLAQAESAEAKLDFVGARDRYRELEGLQDRLDRHGFLEFEVTVDAAAKAREMEEGAADRAYGLAEKQRGAGNYEAAIAGYREAQGFVAGFRDTQAKIADCFMSWAAADAAASQWRTAWGRYLDAARAGAADGTMRAAEIAAALGRWHLGHGACRQAVRDLGEADRLAPGAVRVDLATAQRCAEVRVAVVVDPMPARDVAVLGFDAAARLGPALVERIPDATSDFVVLVDASVLDGPPKDSAGRPVLNQILGARVLSWDLDAPPAVQREVRARAEADIGCVDPATSERTTCVHEFELVYTEVTLAKVASVSATSTLVAFEGSKVLGTRTFDLGARADAQWAENLRDAATGQSAWPNYPGASAVRLPEGVAELAAAPRTLVSDSVLFQDATDDLADQIVDWAAERLDADPPVTDPTKILIQPLSAMPR